MIIPSLPRDLLFGLYHNLPISLGDNIYEYNWDVLILLDACRADSLRTAAKEFNWLSDEFSTIWSVGSQSPDWMENTFTEEYSEAVGETGYITANPYSHEYVESDSLAFIDEVWRDGWDDDLGTVPADAVTDRAITAGRNGEWNRLIVHYMQPHFPSIPDPLGDSLALDEFGRRGLTIWDQIREGDLNSSRAMRSYQANLEYILESVNTLRKNIEANKVIISADHGECFGEWGFYGHPGNKPVPVLRFVPWCQIDATDSMDRQSKEKEEEDSGTDIDISERLKALGYK